MVSHRCGFYVQSTNFQYRVEIVVYLGSLSCQSCGSEVKSKNCDNKESEMHLHKHTQETVRGNGPLCSSDTDAGLTHVFHQQGLF